MRHGHGLRKLNRTTSHRLAMLRNMTVSLLRHEEIKTTLGSFKTLRVQPTAAAGVVKNRGNIWIWYTDDDRHLPVQMRARLFWGTITFRLTGNENK